MLGVLHVVASINPKVGGPAASVPGLAAALSAHGVRTAIASLDYREHGAIARASGVTNISVEPSALGKRLRGWCPELGTAIRSAAAEGIDIVHHHGLWMIPGVYARRTAHRLGLPLVISPRGMLDRWSLERSSKRKAIAAFAYERRNLEAARVLHATSEMEAEAIRRYGLTQPIAVVPNGVPVPCDGSPADRAHLEISYPDLRDRRLLLYMGRMHPKKGLDLLIAAWRELATEFPAWHLIIAGPDLTGYRSELDAMLDQDHATRAKITYTGMLEGEAKRAALRHAQLLVLPSRAENFAIVVAEALAHGVPVVTTTASPWEDVVARGCGWRAAPELSAITEALRGAMERSPDELRAMGERGRQYASRQFAWDTIGARMAQVYRWIVAGGARPACVRES